MKRVDWTKIASRQIRAKRELTGIFWFSWKIREWVTKLGREGVILEHEMLVHPSEAEFAGHAENLGEKS